MNQLKKPLAQIEIFFQKIVSQKTTPLALMLSFLGIIVLRSFEEKFLALSGNLTTNDVLIELLHNLFFFSLTLILIWMVLGVFLRKKPMEMITMVTGACFLVLLPPLFDMAKTGGSTFWSFYLLNDIRSLGWQFVTVFGDLPSGIVYFGSKITFLLAVFLVAGVVGIKTRNIIKTIGSALVTYSILFLMGSFPSWFVFLAYLVQGKSVLEVNAIKVAQFFGSPAQLFGLESASFKYALAYQLNFIFYLSLIFLVAIVFFISNHNKFLAVIKNSRPPQLIYHLGLFGVGLGLGWWLYPHNWHNNFFSWILLLVLGISVWLAWMASVVPNDIYDYQIDLISNAYRPLQKKIFTMNEYQQLGWILFIFSMIGGLTINLTCAAILIAYQIIAWFYSSPPYRLKRFPMIATFSSALASLLIVFLGFSLFSGEEKLTIFPWRIGWLLLISLTLSLPIKDFRDQEGDKKDNVFTLPVLLGQDNGRIFVGTGIFLSFILSAFFLNEKKLFWWAMLFGGMAFWLMNVASWKKRVTNQNLVWWILGLVSLYVIILVEILFIKQ